MSALKCSGQRLQSDVRGAAVTGGALPRMSSGQFVYLDKNYVKLLGGIKGSLKAASTLEGYLKVVQLKGHGAAIAREAREAAQAGAGILFVDTGKAEDVKVVIETLRGLGLRQKVKIAFGGGIGLDDIRSIKGKLDVDILCIGRQLVDAPLLDMRLDVLDRRT